MQQSIRDEEKSDRDAQLKGKVQYSLPPLDQLLIILKTLFNFFKQAISMRMSTVPSLPFQLVFPEKAL
jgi:hypothetical protein